MKNDNTQNSKGDCQSTLRERLVSQQRNYLVLTVAQAKEIVTNWLVEIDLANVTQLGLPEVDDRYHIWRVPLCVESGRKVSEVVIDAYTTEILPKTTKP